MTLIRNNEPLGRTPTEAVASMSITNGAVWRVRVAHVNREGQQVDVSLLTTESMPQLVTNRVEQAVPAIMPCMLIDRLDDERDIADIIADLTVPDLLRNAL